MLEINEADLFKIEQDLNFAEDAAILATGQIAEDLAKTWKKFIVTDGAIDTRAYVSSVASHEQSTREWVVDTSLNSEVTYSLLVEEGSKHNEAEFSARDALEFIHSNNIAGIRFNQAFEMAFKNGK